MNRIVMSYWIRNVRILTAIAALWTAALQGAGVEVWVSPDGDDNNAGTVEAPFASVDQAQRHARELRRLGKTDTQAPVNIILKDGIYPLLQSLLVRPEDAGTHASPTIFRAAEGARPVLSGGIQVKGWRLADVTTDGLAEAARGRVWVAEAPRVGPRRVEFRDLWVNGQRADRARNAYGEEMNEILVWDRDQREAWIPAPAGDWSGELGPLEMVVHQMWAIAMMRVKSMEIVGDRARLTFHEPESRLQFEKPWPFVWIRGEGNDSPYYLTNSLRLLTRPGEWFQDPESGHVYYWPIDGEAMEDAQVIAPHLDTLVRVHGTEERPVEHVHFQGIGFVHTTWMRPTHAGHVPLQAGFYLLDAYSLQPNRGTPENERLENQAWVGRKPAAVVAEGLHNARFEGCSFEHLASAGLDLVRGCSEIEIVGNRFRDIGGNGLVIGNFQEDGIETHLSYDPMDLSAVVREVRVSNNLLTDIANTDWGCVGIITGFVRDVTIEHNEISDISYTGISLGWGWLSKVSVMQNNHVRANHIHHFGKHVYDTAAIYTLSAQPDSTITGNHLHTIYRPSYVHDPHHWSYIYLDEGSDFFTIEDNWTEGVKFSTNRNGENNVWRRTGPHADPAIRQSAGLQADYRYLLNQ